MHFLDLYRYRLSQPFDVSEQNYSDAFDSLCARLATHLNQALQQTLKVDIDLDICIRPLIYLSVYQVMVADEAQAYPEQMPTNSRSSFQNFQALTEQEVGSAIHRLYQELASVNHEEVCAAWDEQASREANNDPAPAKRLRPLRLRGKNRTGISMPTNGLDRLMLKIRNPRLVFVKPRSRWFFPYNPAKRKQLRANLLAALPEDLDAREKAILLYMVCIMPGYLLEGFHEIMKQARGWAESLSVLVSAIEFQRFPEIHIGMCIIKNRNGKLVGSQHGGLYGQTDPTWWERLEMHIFDHYFTWGYQYRDKDIPGVSFRLSRMKQALMLRKPKQQHRKQATALVVAPYFSQQLQMACYCPARHVQFEAFEQALALLRPLLEQGIRLDVRLHPFNSAESVSKRIPALEQPAISVLEGTRRTLVYDAAHYDFVIFSSPNATGMAECITADIPFLITARAEDYLIRQQAEPVYAKLREAGIWCTTCDEVREQLMPTSPQKVLQQQALQLFERYFAQTSTHYWKQWSQQIRAIP